MNFNKSRDKNLNILRTRVLKVEKKHFMVSKGLSVAKFCLRP